MRSIRNLFELHSSYFDKIKLPLAFRISPWQRPLFECFAACTFLIQLLRFAELSPIPFLQSICNLFELHSSYFDEDSASAGFSHFTMAAAAFRRLHLLDSTLALCRAVSYTVLQSICNLFELHSSYFDEDSAVAGFPNNTMAEATL